MKIITLIAVSAILLLQVGDVIPKSSVGGPMMLTLAFLIAMLAVGIHDAFAHKRGVLGWVVSILVAVIGGFLAVSVGSMFMDALLSRLALGGSLASTRHPLLYISSVGMMLLTLLGSWLALRVVDRLR